MILFCKLIIKIIWSIICLVFVVVSCLDFCDAVNYRERYHFGGEGPIADYWWYNTQTLYLWYDIFCVIWFLVGIAFCILQYKFNNLKWGILIHIILTLMLFYQTGT